ncbi:TPA: phage head closure protein [Pseudomonas aeruginosa]|uniref:Phage head-tail adaptor, putative n=1 Tax=Pseudomonas paraeruginosa (strain DSM 24068 / PA7) TaxID=381754 RepID=A6VBQ8_PSEP7|nr:MULTISPECIES: phage head closure protein [Pseudomonas aeruginosa group]ABR86153.1 phage head-tail adaptor, putative [Pseudomonas aeruginosa PA7]EIU1654158.1 phage head closure protein [Pseudomonas aeruginosa]EKE4041858.1 phage head closure protein [Pseudomonas aeruginosa]EKU7384722.1 phage head closure protein [Pseudomonas aeruginosa]EKV0498407.1 phage head closure protein [Pseudomonas aeruginosa]
MNAGRLRHPLNLQRVEVVQDPVTGEVIEDWVTVSREWASIEGVSGREFLAASAEQAETTYRITIRFRDDLDATWRLVSGATTYGIEAILPGNQPVWLVLMCKTL